LQLSGEHSYDVAPFALPALFEDGVVFVGGAADPAEDGLLPHLARALLVPERDQASLLDAILHYLHTRRVLLVLEPGGPAWAREAATFAARLPDHAPGVQVLQLAAGTDPVQTTPAPAGAAAVIQRNDAVALFLARAQAAQPDLPVTWETLLISTALCARLDGLPLAIELAAARSRQFALPDLLRRLEQRLAVLVGSARDVSARHQTLRAAIEWSYDLLTPPLQVLFTACGIFAGGWTAAAASAVAGEAAGVATPDAAADALHRLADNSLIRRVPQPGGGLRFAMLDTIHEYAQGRLATQAEAGAVRRRHTSYFLALAEAVAPQVNGSQPGPARATLATEYPNLRQVLAHPSDDGVDSARLAGLLWPFWDVRGYWSEGRAWLEAFAHQGESLPAEVLAPVLEGAGMLALEQSDLPVAEERFSLAQTVWDRLGDSAGYARVLADLASVARRRNQWDLAAQQLDESRARFAALGDQAGLAGVLSSLGALARAQSNLPAARVYYTESLALYRALNDVEGIAQLLRNLAPVVRDLAGPEAAMPLLEESSRLYRDLDHLSGQAQVLTVLGDTLRVMGGATRAEAAHRESLQLRRQLGDPMGIALGMFNLGQLAADRADWEAARALFGEGLVMFRSLNHRSFEAATLIEFGHLERQAGLAELAHRYFMEALQVSQDHNVRRGVAEAHLGLGMLADRSGGPATAREHYNISLTQFRELGDSIGSVRVWLAVLESAVAGGEATAVYLYGALTAALAHLQIALEPPDQAAWLSVQAVLAPQVLESPASTAYQAGEQAGWAVLQTKEITDLALSIPA
jgi:predicted ATPase